MDIYERIETSGKLPVIPPEISEILNLLLDPTEANMDHIAQKIAECGHLDDMILKYLNLGNLNFTRSIDTVKEAIVYLGAQNIKSILIAFITKMLLSKGTGQSVVFNSEKYWKHCIGTSIACALICEKTQVADKHKMFSMGLIHDIGVTVLDLCEPELLDKIFDLQTKGIHQIVAERMVLGGQTHTDIGVWLCQKWHLSEDFISIVAYHHMPMLAMTNGPEVKVMHLADNISTNYYERLIGINANYIHSEEVIRSVGLTKADTEAILERLPAEVEKVHRLLDFHKVFTLDQVTEQ